MQIIEYPGAPAVFAWKYPSNQLALGAQLVVRET